MDLLLQSMVLRAKPGEIYNRFYRIGSSPGADVPWVGRFTLELQKPCGFLKENWCEIYPARPIGCDQFPEAWYLLPSESPGTPNRGRFQDYPCLKSPSPITTKRKKHLAKLSEMAAQERWISDFYLFGFSPFCVDLRDLVEGLLKKTQREGLAPDGIDPDAQHVIPYTLIEGLFQRKVSEAGITVQIQ
jgi:Fe-S-cluster containining protein